MEDDTITAWYSGTPLMVYNSVAQQFGLSRGSQITDKALYEQIIEENTNLSRAACSLQARALGEECGSCGS